MFPIFLVALIIFAALTYGQSSRDGQLITRRPYNNRYNDASGAREDHVG